MPDNQIEKSPLNIGNSLPVLGADNKQDGLGVQNVTSKEQTRIDFLLEPAHARLRRENKHRILYSFLKFSKWITAAEELEKTLNMGSIDKIPYGDYLAILLGEGVNEKNSSYTTAIELYKTIENLRQFIRNKLQSLLEILHNRLLQEHETVDANKLLTLLQNLQAIWTNDLYAVVMEKIRDEEIANIYWVMDSERKGILALHSQEADIRKLGLTSTIGLSQRVLREQYKRISRALSYTFTYAKGERTIFGLSARHALHEVRGAYARISGRLFPENISATDEWVLCNQSAYSPQEWYLADDLCTFAAKLPELSLSVGGQRVNMIALKDELLRLDESWSSKDVTQEKVYEDLGGVVIPCEGESKNKVKTIVEHGYGWYYAGHEIAFGSEEARLMDEKRLRRMVDQIVALDHIDPPSTSRIIGYLFDVYVFRDLIHSFLLHKPEDAMDGRLKVFDLLPDTEIKEFVMNRLKHIQQWKFRITVNFVRTNLLQMQSGRKKSRRQQPSLIKMEKSLMARITRKLLKRL